MTAQETASKGVTFNLSICGTVALVLKYASRFFVRNTNDSVRLKVTTRTVR